MRTHRALGAFLADGVRQVFRGGLLYWLWVGALSLVGRLEEAREAARRHQAIDPNFTVRRWVETGPFRRTPNQERLFAALREAGLPG